MPAYSIQKDPAWVQKPAPGSSAPLESVFSDDATTFDARVLDHPDMPAIPPLRIQKSYHPSYHAHPEQTITDNGPQVRQSRLPIFKQVRSMLQKPPTSKTSGNKVKYDEFSGDMSDSGKAPHVQPSTYKSPYEGAFEVVRDRRSPTRLQKNPPKSARSTSPVSVVRNEDEPMSPVESQWEDMPPSPISPVSEVSPDYYQIPLGQSPTPVNGCSLPETPSHQKSVTRKSVPSRQSISPQNLPPSQDSNIGDIQGHTYRDPKSHFSWTTYAGSVAPTRPSFETGGYPTSRHSKQPSGEAPLQSRFSWSTVNTNMTNQIRPDSPPPSPPPPVPSKFKTLPVQSILSRHRPIQRADREVWTPPARKTSLQDPATYTPLSARSKLSLTPHYLDTTPTADGKKHLPPPPDILTPVSPMSHLETLIASEQNKLLQRKNILKAIEELEKKEKASPLEVSFAELREAKKKLEEYRKTLAEVQLEEREIGIAISRARRKEGEEEGLWVRRVTG
ncbi:hypothetical protein PRZ48_013232 [Zasmidium cellare]|uniref:Uncharacterized protein n=1 Tax=Zasmidium cellare TaxID=395010 RepID=A0ABR0E3H3_ZASCE|nr:hypothetical protein PRZ48_013232 [Zasmidium cellare]